MSNSEGGPSAQSAMILAAGRGTRLAAMRLNVPKVLVEIGGRPLLQTQLDYLAREGVRQVVVNAHHRAEEIVAFAGKYRGPLSLTVIVERTLLGTAGAVRNALDLLGDDPFFVLYGDVLVDQPFAPITSLHHARGAAATVTVYESEAAVSGKGTVVVDDEDWVTSFAEKAVGESREVDPKPALINAGLYLLDPAFVAELPPGVEYDFGYDLFPRALARGSRVLAYRLARPVLDVGTPEALALARGRMGGASGPDTSSSAASSRELTRSGPGSSESETWMPRAPIR